MHQHEFSSEEAQATSADKYSRQHFFSTWYSPAYVHEMGQGKADQEVISWDRRN